MSSNAVSSTKFSVNTESPIAHGRNNTTVWRGIAASGSPVAIKRVTKAAFEQSEVDILRRVTSPHGVQYRDDFEVTSAISPRKAVHCIVMDLVPVKDIASFFFNSTTPGIRLNLDEIRSIAHQAFEFLAHIDGKIIHCDFKTCNMMWLRAARALTVIDMGSALINGADTADKLSGSTYQYTAPEFILGKAHTSSFDLWSFGCTLFDLVCGLHLFERKKELSELDSYGNLLEQIVHQIGLPSREYLVNCRRANACFDEHMKLKQTWGVPARPNWSEEFSKALDALGVSTEEKPQWLGLMTSLLSYEDRGSARAHIESPLFHLDVNVLLIRDKAIKCKMQLHRAGLVGGPLEAVDPAAIPCKDLSLNFSVDKACCLHIPKDANNQYLLFLEKDGFVVKEIVTLKKGDTLDITSFQSQLLEPLVKKSKIDSRE